MSRRVYTIVEPGYCARCRRTRRVVRLPAFKDTPPGGVPQCEQCLRKLWRVIPEMLGAFAREVDR